MLGERPVSGKRADTLITSDTADNTYSILKDFPEKQSPDEKVNNLCFNLAEERKKFYYNVRIPFIDKLSDFRPHYQINQSHRPGRNFKSFVAYLLQAMVPEESL